MTTPDTQTESSISPAETRTHHDDGASGCTIAFRVVVAVVVYGWIVVSAFRSRTPQDFFLYSGVVAAGSAVLVAVTAIRRGELRVPTAKDLLGGPLLLGALYLWSVVVYSIWVKLKELFLYIYSASLTRTGSIVTFTSFALLLGILLFYFRRRYRALFGLTEAMAGISAAATRYASTTVAGRNDVTFYLVTLTAGVYLIVRGLDNIERGLNEEPKDRFVQKIFGASSSKENKDVNHT